MNQVLTPFSYIFADDGDVFDTTESVVIESTNDSGSEETSQNDEETGTQEDASELQ